MTPSPRAWVLLFGGMTFLTGLSVGRVSAKPQSTADPAPLLTYGQRLEREYALTPERGRALRVVLASYQDEMERVRARHLPTYHAAMEPELASLGERYGAIIRDKVLPQSERRRFVLASEGLQPPQEAR